MSDMWPSSRSSKYPISNSVGDMAAQDWSLMQGSCMFLRKGWNRFEARCRCVLKVQFSGLLHLVVLLPSALLVQIVAFVAYHVRQMT